MGLAVVNNSVNFNADLPIFGNIANKRDLLFAFRPSANALFDLSDNQHTINVQGQVTSQGLLGNISTRTTTTFKEPDSDDITVIICGRVVDFILGTHNRAWLASSYNITSGTGFLVTADMAGGQTDTFDVKLRSYLAVRTSAGQTVSSTPPDIVLALNTKATKTDYLYIVMRIKADTKTVDTRILNKNLSTTRTYAAGNNLTAVGRATATAQNWMINGTPAGSGGLTNNEVQQLLVYGRYLTDAEITEQYEMDKKWLKSARNIEL